MGGRDLGMDSRFFFFLVFAFISLSFDPGFFEGVHGHSRAGPRRSLSFIFEGRSHVPPTAPQQVHISLAGENMMRICWITDSDTDSKVLYGTVPGATGTNGTSATGTSSTYRYGLLYRSGHIHEVVTGPLQPNTTYYYHLGDPLSTPEYNFRTPPSGFPITFAVLGDLGQTEWSKSTLEHIGVSDYDVLLLAGDLSYADSDQNLWDKFGRLVDPYARQRPWMVTEGNHELEWELLGRKSLTAYNARWQMPFSESGSDSNLYYSFNVSGVHVIMLGSYADFDTNSAQYKWLQSDLQKIDREKTPWIVVVLHAPWYNSNSAHQGEPESFGMKASMESLLYQARVDVVFAGHVHAYERFTRVYKDQADDCGPVYITIGDGGNREGLAKNWKPQPSISMFREANYGQGMLQMMNETHARWSWHRDEEDESVLGDAYVLRNLASDSKCMESSAAQPPALPPL